MRRLVDEAAGLTTDDAAGPVFATVADEGGLVVLDDAGARARAAPERDDEAGVRRVVELLELLASARNLRELDSGTGAASLDEPVDVQLTTTRDGAVTERSRHGERLVAGERANLTLTNLSGATLYAWVFDIGISGRVTLVTAAAPSGFALAPTRQPRRHEAGLGHRRRRRALAARCAGRPVVVARRDAARDAGDHHRRPPSGPVRVGDARRRGARRDGARRAGGRGARWAARRAVRGDGPDVLRYRVETVDFFVVPSA